MSSPKTITYARYVKAVKYGINPLPFTSDSFYVCLDLSCAYCPYDRGAGVPCLRTFTDVVELSKQHYQRALTQNPEILI